MFCVHCGEKIDDGASFCSNCGNAASTTPDVELKETNSNTATIKCGNCQYTGPGQYARSTIGIILAWLCIFFAPIITLLYFGFTHKYRCPKCQSTFVAIKNNDGVFVGQGRSPVMIVIWVLVGIAIIGILASIVLVSLNSARQKAREAAQQSTSLSQ